MIPPLRMRTSEWADALRKHQERNAPQWRARYLRDRSLTELADLVGAIAAELAARGVSVAEPLGRAQARIEAYATRQDDAREG
jgi:hypothetical protein